MRRAGLHPQFDKAVPIITYEFYQEQIRVYYLAREDKTYLIFIVWFVEGHIVRFAQLMQINEQAGGVIAHFVAGFIPYIQSMLVSLLNSDVVKHMNLVHIWTEIGNNWMPSYQNLAVDRWENRQLDYFASDGKTYVNRHDSGALDMLAWFMGGGEAPVADESVGTLPEKPKTEDKPSITIDPLDLPPTEPDKWDNALGDEDDKV